MSWRRTLYGNQFRDVSWFFTWIREICLGRKYNLFNRFAPKLAPRTIPKPEVPRGPEYKYSKQAYYTRSFYESVHPPVVAPIAEGPSPLQDKFQPIKGGGMPASKVCFPGLPTPGCPYWWDAHFYYTPAPEEMEKTKIPPFRKPPLCGDPPPRTGK